MDCLRVKEGELVVIIFVDENGEVSAEVQAERDAASQLEADKRFVRLERDRLLASTDYLALSDRVLSAEMATYRQALRDVTSQDSFPYDIVWPTNPEE